jgi:hypothetical protein
MKEEAGNGSTMKRGSNATRNKVPLDRGHSGPMWAVSLVKAVPLAGKKKGADTGIDGVIYFKVFRGEKVTMEFS